MTRKTAEGVKRMLEVFAMPRERPRRGLMVHEFAKAFSSDGWNVSDFRQASHLAFEKGWIDVEAQFYVLTESGRSLMSDVLGPNP